MAMEIIISQVVENLKEEYKRHTSIKGEVESLNCEIRAMKAALRKLGEVPREQLGEHVKLWAGELRELSYKMEVFVDILLVRPPNSDGLKELMKMMCNLINEGRIPHQTIPGIIKDFKVQIKHVVDRYDRYKAHDGGAYRSNNTVTAVDPRLSALFGSVKDLVGIDGKRYQDLVKMLVGVGGNSHNNENKLKIVTVVGSGGLGKTTLVRVVYDNISTSFQCRAFVSAGRNADTKKVLKAIIFDLARNNPDVSTLDEQQLIDNIREMLENKRYLIVIDDIWDENLWQNIKCAFSNDNNLGNRIVTTTRIISVSKASCSFPDDSVYQMEPLSDGDSKKLLYRRISGYASEHPHEFEQVSRDILKKCRGVPLAIITATSVLTTKPKDECYVFIKSIGSGVTIENECWENMRRILSLSYYDLSPQLKTCLLYLSIFPENDTIERGRLVKKWIFEGIVTQETKLIKSSNKKQGMLSEELSLEEAASQCLDELVNRNVIQPLECNNDCEFIAYRIHPMMHDVIKAIAIEEKFAVFLHDKDISTARRMNLYHLSVDCPDSGNLVVDSSTMAFDGAVRSLTVSGYANRFLLRRFQGIRVLDLEGCKNIESADVEHICTMVFLKWLCLSKTQITMLPPQICNLQYLEGLDIGGTQITELPIEIRKLHNLKTLDATKSGVKEIPDQVVQLITLVHLLIGDNESGEGVKLPDGIGKMTSLQQLCTVDLRKCSVSSVKELCELRYLKDIAIVAGDKPEETRTNSALLCFLEKSTHLRSLVVHSDFRLSTLQSSSPYKYLNCRKKLTLVQSSLKVHVDIARQLLVRALDIRVCKLEEDDLKILRELPRLQSLIVRLEVLPTTMVRISSDGFAELESFCVDCRLPRVIFEEGAMPKLGHLELTMYAGSASEKHMGIKHLLNLQEVHLRYFKWYAANKGLKETTEAVKTEAKEHQNMITLCIAEENKDGTCTMKTEIFPENKDAGFSRMAEAEEKDEHVEGTGGDTQTQEGGLHQRNFANASNSGTNEIEEVVE